MMNVFFFDDLLMILGKNDDSNRMTEIPKTDFIPENICKFYQRRFVFISNCPSYFMSIIFINLFFHYRSKSCFCERISERIMLEIEE